MTTFLLISLTLGLLGYWYHRRRGRLLSEENVVRVRLGLPALTRSQFEMQVVEKSAEFRANINQHM